MGHTKQSIIEVNGKRYDAHTGQLIGGQSAAEPVTKHPRRASESARRPVATHHLHKNLQRSKTLMRTGVKRPARTTNAVKPATSHAVSDIQPAHQRGAGGAVNLTATHDAAREARAHKIERSRLVSKFKDFGVSTQPLAAGAVPQRLAVMPVVQAPAALPAHKPLHLKESLIARGLLNATSHTEKHEPKSSSAKSRRKRGRLATYGAGALAALLLVGFIAFQNIPNISVRYAATRSGVAASLPGYHPSGFALENRIEYNPGQIKLSYSSNTDERNFSITQRESNWNSDTLMSNYVAEKSDQVQTYEDKGRTIYLYGDSGATWVSSGVWYDINGNSQLNSDQLIRIATSM